jgi:hypothetical protein
MLQAQPDESTRRELVKRELRQRAGDRVGFATQFKVGNVICHQGSVGLTRCEPSQALALRGQKLMHEQTKASLRLLQAQQDYDVLNEASNERARELIEAREAAEAAKNRKDEARGIAMEIHNKFSERIRDVIREWMATAESAESSLSDELEEEKERCKAKLALTGQTNERVVRQYENRKVKVSGGFSVFGLICRNGF